jgi:DNA-binding CsgD family transcriptional regulator
MEADGALPAPLLDAIYDSATDEGLWRSVLVQIADLTHSQGGVLFGQSIRRRIVYFDHNGRLSEECNNAYKERHMHNPWALYMDAQPAGRVVPSDMVLPVSELRRTPFYDDVLHPQDVAHNAMVAIGKRQDFNASFNLCRSARRGPFDDKELEFVRRLVPHLMRSMALRFRLEGYHALQRAEYHVLDRLAVGIILLDRAGKMIFANKAARALGDAGPLSLRNGKPATTSPSHTRRLDEVVQAALRGAPTASMSLPNPDGGLLTILVSSVRGRDIGRFFDAGLRDAAALMFVLDPANRTGIPSAWLMDAYGFTQAEAKVALAVSSGLTMPETAKRLGSSPNTIKTHLRRAFAKSGTSRQSELAGLIASIGLISAAAADDKS